MPRQNCYQLFVAEKKCARKFPRFFPLCTNNTCEVSDQHIAGFPFESHALHWVFRVIRVASARKRIVNLFEYYTTFDWAQNLSVSRLTAYLRFSGQRLVCMSNKTVQAHAFDVSKLIKHNSINNTTDCHKQNVSLAKQSTITHIFCA